MNALNAAAGPEGRLHRLLGFLGSDPDNLGLIADAASAALDEGDLAETTRLLDRYAAISLLTPALLNLKGVAAISGRRFEEAASVFESLRTHGADDPAIRFNLAWSRFMTRDFEAALPLLDDAVIATTPRAAALKVQMLHHLGLLEEALACGMGLAELYPDDQALMGALAVVAIDAEELELAAAYAGRAGESHEGLSTLGMLQLNDDQIDASLALFDRALTAYGASGRALLGRGLALLIKGEPAEAVKCLDRSAAIFGAHVGTWLTSGWAHFLEGDYTGARASFEKALALDDTFAESQGALAVVDVVENQMGSARRRADIALRLDRECLAGALAKSMILASEGRHDRAEQIRNIALNSPIGPDGRTITQMMVGLGMAGPKGS